MYDTTNFTDFKSFVVWAITDIGNPLMRFLFGLAVVLFLWGALRYVRALDNAEQREESRGFMFWGIVALAVIAALWALVAIVVNTITGPNVPPPPPQEPRLIQT